MKLKTTICCLIVPVSAQKLHFIGFFNLSYNKSNKWTFPVDPVILLAVIAKCETYYPVHVCFIHVCVSICPYNNCKNCCSETDDRNLVGMCYGTAWK